MDAHNPALPVQNDEANKMLRTRYDRVGIGRRQCLRAIQKLSRRDQKILQVGSSITQLPIERNGSIVRHRKFVRKETSSVM